jgi:hypothetical protein
LNKVGYASNHTQDKVSVKTDTALAFKKACEVRDISMASAISQFMEQFCGAIAQKPGYSPDLSTRRQRRAAVGSITHQLERVRDNEEQYLENIPDNLRSGAAFDNAEHCISMLEEALDLLTSAY